MKTYITADSHFDHEAMHTLCGRPKGYEQKILRILSSSISKDDLLIHLGDFCWHKDAYWHEQFMALVPCKKWITLGNHD
jgi:calcineurin-like phosphoesterase family protein